MVGYRRVFVLGESTRPGKWIYNISRVYNLSERLIHYCTISHSDIVLNTVQQAFEHCKDFKPLRRGTNRKKPKLHNLVSTLFEVFLYLFLLLFMAYLNLKKRIETVQWKNDFTFEYSHTYYFKLLTRSMTYNFAACKNIDKHWTFFLERKARFGVMLLGFCGF